MLAAWETAPAPAALLEALGARLLAGEAAALAAPDAARALRCLRACGPAAFCCCRSAELSTAFQEN